MKIEILVKFNQYESKRYFASKMSEAFKRIGVEADATYTDDGKYILEWIKKGGQGCDLACSFNRFGRSESGTYIWEQMSKPFVSILVDPVIYNTETFRTPNALATCVDRDDCALVDAYGAKNMLFMPHAVEPELSPGSLDRVYPVVLIGTCYDPDHLKAYWRKTLSAEWCSIIEESIEDSFADTRKTFVQATKEALEKRGIKPENVPFRDFCYYVDYYMRGHDRVELIRSIRDAEVHIFGGTCWRKEKPIAGWNYYFAKQPNVVLHPAVTFEESLDVLRRTKICLNSTPMFRNGSHERVLASYACGAMPISSENLYWREEFGNDIILYAYNDRKFVSEKIKELLANEPLRRSYAERGRERVMRCHTWDQRVKIFVEKFLPKQ